jgi:hypothetical protein
VGVQPGEHQGVADRHDVLAPDRLAAGGADQQPGDEVGLGVRRLPFPLGDGPVEVAADPLGGEGGLLKPVAGEALEHILDMGEEEVAVGDRQVQGGQEQVGREPDRKVADQVAAVYCGPFG